MGEIDTKPIESVQTALSFFDQRNDQRNNSPKKDEEAEKERELESLEKELANVRVQLEAKDSAYKQALLKIDHHQKIADELSILLKNSDLKKDSYISGSREAKIRISELESTLERMAHQLSESDKLQEQLLQVTSDLESTQGQVLSLEAELVILSEAKVKSLSQIQAMEMALDREKLENAELLSRVSEMNEAITRLKMKAIEVEKEYTDALSTKEAEFELSAKAVSEAKERQASMKQQLESMHDLENQLVEKSSYIDSLQLELKQANELHMSSGKVASDAICELNQLKEDMEFQEKKNLDQAAYISLLETELKQLGTELGDTKAEVSRLNEYVENVMSELEKTKEQENDAQIEIALLKFELHKGNSKLAAAEAAEVRAQSEKSALYNALQQMGLEAEETKRENRLLKEAMKLVDASKSSHPVELPEQVHSQAEEPQENGKAKTDLKEEATARNKNEDLTKKAEEEKQIHDHLNENCKELEKIKRELELAVSKIGELRTRAEQSISRAEAAEKTKAALEEMVKKRKEQKERRKAALTALREESVSRDFSTIKHDTSAKYSEPLGKVLNMKF